MKTTLRTRYGETGAVLVLLIALHALWRVEVAAQSIGINFIGGAGESGTLSASDVAGVPGFAQPFWNNAPGSSGFLFNLVDNTGLPTSINAEVRGIAGVGSTGVVGVGADFTLMQGYLRSTAAGIGIVLSEIPYPVYDVIVYLAGPLSTSSGSSGNYSIVPRTSMCSRPRPRSTGRRFSIRQPSPGVLSKPPQRVRATTIGSVD